MEEHGEGNSIEQARKSQPQLACQFGKFEVKKIVPDKEFLNGESPEGWYQATVLIRPMTDGKPREIPEEVVRETIANEMARVSAWTLSLIKGKWKETIS
mgnify:CR=1 FL=1